MDDADANPSETSARDDGNTIDAAAVLIAVKVNGKKGAFDNYLFYLSSITLST